MLENLIGFWALEVPKRVYVEHVKTALALGCTFSVTCLLWVLKSITERRALNAQENNSFSNARVS